jgi:hypothetical protein
VLECNTQDYWVFWTLSIIRCSKEQSVFKTQTPHLRTETDAGFESVFFRILDNGQSPKMNMKRLIFLLLDFTVSC